MKVSWVPCGSVYNAWLLQIALWRGTKSMMCRDAVYYLSYAWSYTRRVLIVLLSLSLSILNSWTFPWFVVYTYEYAFNLNVMKFHEWIVSITSCFKYLQRTFQCKESFENITELNHTLLLCKIMFFFLYQGKQIHSNLFEFLTFHVNVITIGLTIFKNEMKLHWKWL